MVPQCAMKPGQLLLITLIGKERLEKNFRILSLRGGSKCMLVFEVINVSSKKDTSSSF